MKKQPGPKPKPPDELMVRMPIRLPPELKRSIEQHVAEVKARQEPFNYSVSKFITDAALFYLAHLQKK